MATRLDAAARTEYDRAGQRVDLKDPLLLRSDEQAARRMEHRWPGQLTQPIDDHHFVVRHRIHDREFAIARPRAPPIHYIERSEEHTSELQSLAYLVCRLLLEKKNNSGST